MTLTDTLTIYDAQTTDRFGDDVVSTSTDVAAFVDENTTWRHASFADVDASTITAWISPDEELWQSVGRALVGRVAQYGDASYRITAVHPGSSLLFGTADLVELGLTKLETTL